MTLAGNSSIYLFKAFGSRLRLFPCPSSPKRWQETHSRARRVANTPSVASSGPVSRDTPIEGSIRVPYVCLPVYQATTISPGKEGTQAWTFGSSARFTSLTSPYPIHNKLLRTLVSRQDSAHSQSIMVGHGCNIEIENTARPPVCGQSVH